MSDGRNPIEPRPKGLFVALDVALIAVPLLVLAGWQFNLPSIRAILGTATPMNPLTALCFLGLGLHSTLSRRHVFDKRFAEVLMVVIMLATTGRAVAYWLGWPFPFDQLLFHADLLAERVPNRMALNTAGTIALLATSFLLAGQGSARLRATAQVLTLIAGFVGLLVLNCYALEAIHADAAAIPMALNTAFLVLVSCAAILVRTPDEGCMRVFFAKTMAARSSRRLLWLALALPVALCLIIARFQSLGHLSTDLGEAVLVTTVILAFMVTIWGSGLMANQSEYDVLLAKEEAERANLAKSEFLSRMSHELRTPLNSILGFAQMLELEDHGKAVTDSAHHILRGGRHLLGMINEILELSRIEAGHLSISLEPVEFAPLIRETISLMKPVADTNQIELVIDSSIADGVFVRADRQRLLQVCLNLISNAVKYNVAGGMVTVAVRSASADRLVFEVADSGRGIAEDHLAELFSPFARLGADTLGIEGTGLGLALSKGLTECMGGRLTYRRNDPAGSVFAVELSTAIAALTDPVPAVPAEVKEIRAGPDRIALLIEDNAPNVQLIERILKSRGGIQLLVAMQGRLGLDLAGEHRPDLILLDANLPDLSGLEVLRKLKSSPELAAIPVIVTSADATTKQISAFKAAGAMEYLTKPLDVTQLLAVIDQAIGEVRRVA